jgi:small membrane protein
MTAQIALTVLLAGVLVYAGNERRRSPVVAWLSIVAAVAGLYCTWVPDHATSLAHWAGIGRGVDLVIYIWVCITLIVLLNLHLKLRTQMELVTALARTIALTEARAQPVRKPERRRLSRVGRDDQGAAAASRQRLSRLT